MPKIRLLDQMPDIAAASDLIGRVWSAPQLMPANLTRAIQQSGGYVAGAFDGFEMIGASVAFRGMGTEDGQNVPTLHSHVTGVTRPGCGIGTALKHHQRQWSAENGIAAITWTFDPLVARNAWFNLTTLGVECRTYLPDHYGAMTDGINAGDRSDRLAVWWPTSPIAVRDAGDDAGLPVTPLLRRGDDDLPELLKASPNSGGRGILTVQIPTDIAVLRRRDMPAAVAWRMAVRDTLGDAMSRGFRLVGMDVDGAYRLLAPTDERTSGP